MKPLPVTGNSPLRHSFRFGYAFHQTLARLRIGSGSVNDDESL